MTQLKVQSANFKVETSKRHQARNGEDLEVVFSPPAGPSRQREGEMTKSVCAFETRNIRYIVDAQGFNPQQKALQGCNIRYIVDGQGLRYYISWQRKRKIQFIIDNQ
jgi:hypothetical protein